MNKQIISRHLREWADCRKQCDAALDLIDKAFTASPESAVITAMETAFLKYTELLEKKLGIGPRGKHEGWLTWDWLENRMGIRGLKAGRNGKLRSIRNIKDLTRLVEALKEKK